MGFLPVVNILSTERGLALHVRDSVILIQVSGVGYKLRRELVHFLIYFYFFVKHTRALGMRAIH